MKSKHALLGALVLALLTSPAAAAVISTFTGGDTGEGLDLEGNFHVAVNMGGSSGPTLTNGTTALEFKTEAATAGLYSTTGASTYSVIKPSYGTSTNDDNLALMMQTGRYHASQPNNFDISLNGLTVGEIYKLQLLFHEPSHAMTEKRRFNVIIPGADPINNFDPVVYGSKRGGDTGVVITHEFIASQSSLTVGFTKGLNDVPYVSGATMENVPDPLSVATAVWHFADMTDSATNQSTLSHLQGTGTINEPAAMPIAARNSDNRVFDAGDGGKTTTSDHGWIGINSTTAPASTRLRPQDDTSLSVFTRVRWTGQFNFQNQPTGTDHGVDDILRYGHTSLKTEDWYALQLYTGDQDQKKNATLAKAQFVLTGKDAISETALRHDSMLSLDTWYDITGVFNSDEQTATIYVFDPQTGREVGTAQTITGLSFSSLETAAGNLLMMVSPGFGEGPNPNAQMDLAAVWHTALTPVQVAYLSYVPEPGTAFMLLVAVGLLLLRRRHG